MNKAFKFNEFKKSATGVAAIEFAILLPFLLIVLFGVYQVTTYILAVRKIDNVTNDIGYILSREGCITSPATGACIVSGGRNELEAVFSNVIPFLIYPYKYADISSPPTTSQIQVKFVGLPVFGVTGACPGDGIDRKTVRLMWEELYPLGSTSAQITADTPGNQSASACSGSNCPSACDGKPYKSTYTDGTNQVRANIIFPGQSFVIVNFAYDFQALLGDNFIGVVLPHNIEKLSSYPSRSRLGNVTDPITGAVTPVVLNNMNLCTNCSVLNSTYPNDPDGGSSLPMTAGGGSAFRQICDPLLPSALPPNNYSNSGGCNFY